MSLETGTYQIKSTPTKNTIGRNFIETRSLFPKDILLQSQPGYEFHDTLWQIERSQDETRSYHLKIRGASAGLLDNDTSGQIVAMLVEGLEGYSRKWTLRPAAENDDSGGQTLNICNCEEENNLVWTIKDDKNDPEGDKVQLIVPDFESDLYHHSKKQLLFLADYDPSNPNQAFTFIEVVN